MLLDNLEEMTKEEAISTLKDNICSSCPYLCSTGMDSCDIRECDNRDAIKALEQESILNKIRAEIENHCGLAKENHCKYCSYCNNVMGVREILEIIDKYKAESEE